MCLSGHSWVDVGNKLRWVIDQKYAPLLRDVRETGPRACKFAGAFVMLLSLLLACVYVGDIGVGMPDEFLVLDSSYLCAFSCCGRAHFAGWGGT